MSEMAAGRPELVTCSACERKVPPGSFCGVCGAHLATQGRAGAQRRHAYAADPGQAVLRPLVISTLLPHLPRRRSAPFRIALLISLALLALLGLMQITIPAIVVAATAVPALYLIYLYEVEVYENEPFLVVGLVGLSGVVLGGLWAHFAGGMITNQGLIIATFGVTPDRVMLDGVLLPVAAQVVMLVPALLMLVVRRGRFTESMDGFTFGAAAALGFSLAATLVDLYPELGSGTTSSAPIDRAFEIVERGILLPIVNASSTGLVCAALWLLRGPRRPQVRHRLASLPASAVSAVLAQGLLGVGAVALSQPWELFVLYLVIGPLLLLMVRFALHSMLLAEAVEVGIGPPIACTHCHHVVPRMAFCPNCGIAIRATPKTGVGREARGAR